MSTNESVTWPHTGVTAPVRFEVRGAFYSWTMAKTSLIGAEVIHPDLGMVGLIQNAGDGSPSTFHAWNNARFGVDALTDIAEVATQDGAQLDPGETGIDHLLDVIMAEAEYAEAVARMRLINGFLMRTWSRRRGRIHRGRAIPSGRILTCPEDRACFAEQYALDPATRLSAGETWEFFNGREWTQRMFEPLMRAEKAMPRLSEILAVYDATTQRTPAGYVKVAGPLQDGMFVTGAVDDKFLLTEEGTRGEARFRWCTCPRPSQAHRFEHWNVRHRLFGSGLFASGTLHAGCDRLLTID